MDGWMHGMDGTMGGYRWMDRHIYSTYINVCGEKEEVVEKLKVDLRQMPEIRAPEEVERPTGEEMEKGS